MHVLILKIDAPDIGKRVLIDHINDALIAAKWKRNAGDPRRDIEVVSVMSATPKRLDNAKKGLKRGTWYWFQPRWSGRHMARSYRRSSNFLSLSPCRRT